MKIAWINQVDEYCDMIFSMTNEMTDLAETEMSKIFDMPWDQSYIHRMAVLISPSSLRWDGFCFSLSHSHMRASYLQALFTLI